MKPENIDTIRQLRAEGVTNDCIAAQFRLSKANLERIVRENDMPRKPAKVGAAKIAKLRQLWADGVRANDIASALGISRQSVNVIARRESLPERAGMRKGGNRQSKEPAPASAPQIDPYADVQGIEGEILRTRGRYAQLAAVALFNGLTMREVTCRWHKLRDGKEIYA
jgi:hypothetical protein